jgi:hypothetical protein
MTRGFADMENVRRAIEADISGDQPLTEALVERVAVGELMHEAARLGSQAWDRSLAAAPERPASCSTPAMSAPS